MVFFNDKQAILAQNTPVCPPALRRPVYYLIIRDEKSGNRDLGEFK